MHEANDLLKAMEAEAAKIISTPTLKELLRWTERITDTSGDWEVGIAKRSFVLHQYFSLQLLNEMYEGVEIIVNQDFDLYRYQDRDRYPHLYRYQDRDRYLNRDLYLYLRRYLNRDRYPHLYRYLDLYQDVDLNISLDLYRYLHSYFGICQDFYQHMDAKFYPLVSNGFGHRFDRELCGRVTFIKHLEQMKIFKGVDLHRMILRFNEQQEFIRMAIRGESIDPPAESIHDTWLSVLSITDEMLSISREELETYLSYLRAVELIIACKEAAGRVSPDVWQEIEDRLLAWDAEEPED